MAIMIRSIDSKSNIEEIRRRKDTIRIKYRFKDYRPSIIEAFYNDKKPQYMGTDVTYFEVEN